MAQQIKDEHWLKHQLMDALHWDEDVAESVLGLILGASTPDEVEQLTAEFMDNNPIAVCAISDFMAARKGPGQQQQQALQQAAQVPPDRSRQQQQQQGSTRAAGSSSSSATVSSSSGSSSYKTSVSAVQPAGAKQQPAAGARQQQDKWLHLGGHPPASEPSTAPEPAAQQVTSKQQAEATLSMFKRGTRSSGRPAREAGGAGGGRRKGEQLESITAKLERKVANCLSCGKIFDCRNVTNDIIRFIDTGFKCTYCGAAVAMTQQEHIQQAQQQQQLQQDPAAAESGGAADAADAQAKAVAFKDRLVDYDRHSQRRTTVIDDQSDFFEIDTNAWLTEEERAELRRRAQLEEEAAAARRNKVTVTLDLLGRKVVVADGSGSGAGGSSSSSFELGGVSSATQQLLQEVQSAVAHDGGAGGPGGDRQGGGGDGSQGPGAAAGEGKAPAETLAEALAAISNLRITANPSLTTAPVFIPKRKQQQQAVGGKVAEQGSKLQGLQQNIAPQQQRKPAAVKQQAPGAKAAPGHGQPGNKQQKQQQRPANEARQRLSAAASRAAAADSRVQDDSIFGDFEAELLCDELLQKRSAHTAA